MTIKPVTIEGCKVSDNKFRSGSRVWIVANLIEHAKGLPVFDLPLAAVHSGCQVWAPITSPYEFAQHMRRVVDVDTSHPVILDQEGFIMDGWHRVARALLDRKASIPAVRFETTPPADYEKVDAP